MFIVKLQKNGDSNGTRRLPLAALGVLVIVFALLGSRKGADRKSRVCLNMIAKDEAENLHDTLVAVAPHISGWFVCDTGSTDGTPTLLEKIFNDLGIPGLVAKHEWKDFAHNRNRCLQDGVRTMKGKCDYWLILDADQIFVSETGASLAKMPLKKDAYWIEERSHGLTFHNLRLVSTKVEWIYEGAIHEHILPVGGQEIRTGTLPASMYTLHDNEYGRGFEKDAAALEEALARDPLNPRNNFYLGNTYMMLERRGDAIGQYMKRMKLGSSSEEVYMSALTTANTINSWFMSLTSLDDFAASVLREYGLIAGNEPSFEEVESAFRMAADVLPYRKEAWYQLAHLHWVQENDADTCYKYAIKARDAGPHDHRTLFSDIKIVEFMVNDQICTCAYPAGAYRDGWNACHALETKLIALGNKLESWQHEMLAVTRQAKQLYAVHLK